MKLDQWLKFAEQRRVCAPGVADAKRVCRHGCDYPIDSLMQSDLEIQNKSWLLHHHADVDEKSLKLLRKWVRSCCNEVGIASPVLGTPDDCMRSLREAIRRKSRQGGLRAARAWSDEKLKAVTAGEGI